MLFYFYSSYFTCTAYEAEARILYKELLDRNIHYTTVARLAFKSHEWFPLTPFLKLMLPSFIEWIKEKKVWEEVAVELKELRQKNWVITNKTESLKRAVTKLEHPYFLNPYQTLIQIILAILTGRCYIYICFEIYIHMLYIYVHILH